MGQVRTLEKLRLAQKTKPVSVFCLNSNLLQIILYTKRQDHMGLQINYFFGSAIFDPITVDAAVTGVVDEFVIETSSTKKLL